MPPADSLKEDPLFDEFDKGGKKKTKKGKDKEKKKDKENKPVQKAKRRRPSYDHTSSGKSRFS